MDFFLCLSVSLLSTTHQRDCNTRLCAFALPWVRVCKSTSNTINVISSSVREICLATGRVHVAVVAHNYDSTAALLSPLQRCRCLLLKIHMDWVHVSSALFCPKVALKETHGGVSLRELRMKDIMVQTSDLSNKLMNWKSFPFFIHVSSALFD